MITSAIYSQYYVIATVVALGTLIGGYATIVYIKKLKQLGGEKALLQSNTNWKSLSESMQIKIQNLENDIKALQLTVETQSKEIVKLQNLNQELFSNFNEKPYTELRKYLDKQFRNINRQLAQPIKTTLTTVALDTSPVE